MEVAAIQRGRSIGHQRATPRNSSKTVLWIPVSISLRHSLSSSSSSYHELEDLQPPPLTSSSSSSSTTDSMPIDFLPLLWAFMASLSRCLMLLCSFTCLIHSSRSRTLILPLAKDASTLQYVATVYHGPSLDPVELAVDLGGPSLWLDCSASSSSSSSVRRVPCRSIQCLAATSDDSGLRRAYVSGAAA